jgi:uncharacterized protein (DUF2267 family)
MTGITAFDATLQKTQEWLRRIIPTAFAVLRATLHAIRDRLPVVEAVHFGAQLPLLVRGVYYEGYSPAGKPTRERNIEAFIAGVRAELRRGEDFDVEGAVRVVCQVIAEHVAWGTVGHVREAMPKPLRELWPN